MAATTYRCSDSGGRVTFQDFPCTVPATRPEQQAEPSSPVSTGNDYSTTTGNWRGPAQFQFVAGGKRDLNAHQVLPLVIEIGPDGKVQGVISEAGCGFAGLASQFVTPRSASIDVTFKGCSDARFNTRLAGHLHSNPAAKEASLQLSAIGYGSGMKVQQVTIKAVLRR
jgi:hypothetical protein